MVIVRCRDLLRIWIIFELKRNHTSIQVILKNDAKEVGTIYGLIR